MSTAYKLGKEICKTLFRAGYTAYFAGGWVRDFLLQQTGNQTEVMTGTSEIDIATSAPPYVISQLFPKTIPVGIAFGVVIIVMHKMNFEVTTFRIDHPYVDGRHPEGVDFSTAEKDAQRRDFTINGMFYDPLSEILYDYVGGQKDLHDKIIRAIGDPVNRFTEDRLRMIRAVRFSARLGFPIESQTVAAIAALAHTLLPAVSMERIWQEFCKMASYPHFDSALIQLHHLHLLSTIFPTLKDLSDTEIEKRVAPFVYFPKSTPPILLIMELFPNAPLEEKIQLCLYLKTTVQERKWIEFFHASRQLMAQPPLPPHVWAHFYAHPLSSLFIGMEGAKLLPPKKLHYFEEHEVRRTTLESHIVRIQQRTPLVTATHLMERGITPGKEMGTLLKQAEAVAIDHNLSSPEEVLNRLLKKR